MKIVNRLVALGLSRPLAVKLEREITKWHSKSGPEWTVARLKQLKVALINHIAGRDMDLRWIRMNEFGLPHGAMSELFRMTDSKRGRFLAVNALMVYSSFVSESVTEVQREKFFGSMESKETRGLNAKCSRKFSLGHVPFIESGTPWTNARLSPSSFQPGKDGRSYPETDTFVSFMGFTSSDTLVQLGAKHNSIFDEVVPMGLVVDTRMARAEPIDVPFNTVVGKISYIQEPGYKLRAVANPNRVAQHALEPLKEVLGFVLGNLSNDFTFDQNAGVQLVQGWLKKGLTVYSVDLSDATNNFPLSYTESVLKTRITVNVRDRKRYDSLVEIFAELSRAPWFSKESGTVRIHRFTRGQPLGLGPSFFAFALSHNCLLLDLCKDSGVDPHEAFAILGDDICISNPVLYTAYRLWLSENGCPVSEAKTMTSGKIAEFAGKLILKDQVIPQFKWRELDDSNVVDFVKNVGPTGVSLLNKNQRALIDVLADVPDFLGGLGWNPEGISLDFRLAQPFCQFLLLRDLEVSLPQVRVDRPLMAFIRDPRLKELTQSLTGLVNDSLIPARGEGSSGFGTRSFWKRFHQAQSQGAVLPFEIEVLQADSSSARESSNPRSDRYLYYIPSWKDVGEWYSSKPQPWFALVRYFERNQRRLEAVET